MAKGFRVFVNDARKGVTFRTGFEHGYLTPIGKIDTWPSFGEVFRTVEDAKDEMELRGIADETGVKAGRLTGYVVEAL